MIFELIFMPRNKYFCTRNYSGPLLQKVISQINEAKCEILQVGIPNIYIHEYGTYQEILNFLRVDSKSLRSIAQDFFTL